MGPIEKQQPKKADAEALALEKLPSGKLTEQYFWPLQSSIEKSAGQKRADKFYSSTSSNLEGTLTSASAASFKNLVKELNKYKGFTPIERENIKSDLIRKNHADIAKMIN